jgi:hypothetical protein
MILTYNNSQGFAIEMLFKLNLLSEKGYVHKFVTYIDDIDIQSDWK